MKAKLYMTSLDAEVCVNTIDSRLLGFAVSQYLATVDEFATMVGKHGHFGTVKVDEPGMYVVKCDVHGWMQAFIRVDPHPFHSVTDSDGRFRIEGLPPGNYTLELWHEKFGTLARDVRIDDTASTTIEIEYSP